MNAKREANGGGEAHHQRSARLSALGGGANQAGGRAYNERLALSLIRLNGPLSRAELARLTGLTPQTLSHIVKRLESDGLLTALPPERGRIGQPSTPYALNPEGAYSFGVKIGRRSIEIVLCDFLGRIVKRARESHAYPLPGSAMDFIARHAAAMRKPGIPLRKITGLGIAMPFELWKWADDVDAPAGALEGWRGLDAAAEATRRTGLKAYLANDATAACGAELARDPHSAHLDFLYLFIGSFAGGGVVINGALYQGRGGNAGALGSMPVRLGGKTGQLIKHASLITLEHQLRAAGRDAGLLQSPDADWSPLGRILDAWISRSAKALAQAAAAASAVIDFQRVCIDGALPRDVLRRLIEHTRLEAAKLALEGLSPFAIEPGGLGAEARALGGAILPMAAAFSTGKEMLLKR